MKEEYVTIKQIESALRQADDMVAQAKATMNETQLYNATKSMEEAKEKLNQAKILQFTHESMLFSNGKVHRPINENDEKTV
ncbi:DUF2564 family protein [Salipaludibacillus daqingensis]|uniref:DUF2564 family protein n=1 Tax=Salipaludibacillus daqingensis TaxID=3041001 RepID=UPI0024733894|nr:DUF2564 family protein [Salipaludibacillus daqingensis]